MSKTRYRIEVMHGVNLDQLGRRDPLHYGTLTLPQLERQIEEHASTLELATSFFHTNHEGAFVEHLHSLRQADAILLNPGSWNCLLYTSFHPDAVHVRLQRELLRSLQPVPAA